MLLGAVASSAILAACDSPPPPRSVERPSAPPKPAAAAAQSRASAAPSRAAAEPPQNLPPGVLAETKGISGSILRVEERDGYRLLLIDGVIHAARRISGEDDPFSLFAMGDPLVRLLIAVRGEAQSSVLVVGLGSGATATELRDVKKKVDVVEIEPAIVDLAKKFFDYKGDATIADGIAYLKQGKNRYDAVILDAFAGNNLPKHFVEPSSVEALKKRVASRGVAVVRMLARPSDPHVIDTVIGIGGAFSYRRLLGSGAGDEEQNLYLIASDAPINLTYLNEISLWPIPLPDERAPKIAQTPKDPASHAEAIKTAILSKTPTKVALAGYLVRGEDGSLTLDLPHWEMGSRRYALRGPEALLKELAARLPPKSKFPTAGDLSTDGDTSKTLYPMLGGGGVKLSLVRFSPVVAAVSGILRQTTSHAPQGKPAELDPNAFGRPGKIPKGILEGARAELVIDKIHFTIDLQAWKTLRQNTTRPIVARAQSAAAKGQLEQAGAALGEVLGALDKKLGSFGPRIIAYDEILALREALLAHAPKTSGAPSAFERAAACDRADNAFRIGFSSPLYTTSDAARDALPVDAALLACAERGYSDVVQDPKAGDDVKTKAAARLVAILEERASNVPWEQKARSRAMEAQIQALKENFGVKPEEEPPP